MPSTLCNCDHANSGTRVAVIESLKRNFAIDSTHQAATINVLSALPILNVTIRFRFCAVLFAALLALPCAAQVSTKPITDFRACAKPEWPREALRNSQHGIVTLEFLIDTDGTVKDSRIIKSSGFPLLDEAAQQGIRKCAFRPGSNQGTPIESWMQMQYVWTLSSKANDPEAQLKRLRASAELGKADAQFKLGSYFALPNTPYRDLVKSEAWLRKAAEQGHAGAQNALAIALTGFYGAKQNMEEAGIWFSKAAEKGNANAQFMVGLMLLRGQGVERNNADGMSWLGKAAAQGNARAQAELGSRLILLNPSPKSMEEGLALLVKAGEQGHIPAIDELGDYYASGTGIQRDMVKAAAFYQQAAGMGHVKSMLSLAAMYEEGEGVLKDAEKAKQLRDTAARQSKPAK